MTLHVCFKDVKVLKMSLFKKGPDLQTFLILVLLSYTDITFY